LPEFTHPCFSLKEGGFENDEDLADWLEGVIMKAWLEGELFCSGSTPKRKHEKWM